MWKNILKETHQNCGRNNLQRKKSDFKKYVITFTIKGLEKIFVKLFVIW